MSFASLLTHVVHIERDADSMTEDDYGVAETAVAVGGDFRAAIQPRSAREIAAATNAGAPLSDYVIFMTPRVLDPADRIVHITADCPLADVADFGDIAFEIDGIRNAAGIGHHLEVDVRSIGVAAATEGS